MLRGGEPEIGVRAAPRARKREDSVRSRTLGIGLVVVIGLTVACHNEGATSGTQRPPGNSSRDALNPFSGLGHVGNQVRGIDAMPDYDAEAEPVRARVEPRLPSPLPSPRAACVTMLDGARQFYVDTEGEDSLAVRTMDRNRDADLADCTEQTSPVVASCVAVLMAENAGEFPWVLDQCRRAFTKGDAEAG